MEIKKYRIARRSTTATATEPVHQPHDKGYKDMFSVKRYFMHFLKKYIRADWVDSIDENALDLIDKTFIDADFKQKESDVIYKLKLKDREIIFYILQELQSSVDFTMPFRLLRYMTALLKREFRNTPKSIRELKGFRLPAIVPIVMYTGSANWTVIQSFKEYLQGYEQFGEYLIDFKYLLFDLTREPEEMILSTNEPMDIVFALDRTERDDMERIWKIVSEQHLNRMDDDEQEETLNWVRYIYLSHIKDEAEKDRILSNLKRGEITNMVSGLGRIVQEERLEGKKEKAIEMLLNGEPISKIIKYTKLTEDKIKELQEELK